MSTDKDYIKELMETVYRVDERTIQMDRRLENIEAGLEKQNGRIDKIEVTLAERKGAIGILSGVVAVIVTFGSLLLAKLLNL